MADAWGTGPIVDLGDTFDPPVRPESRTTPRRAVLRYLRQFRLAVPVCAVVLLASAGAAPRAEQIRLVARVPIGVDASVMIAGSDLYVYEAGVLPGADVFTIDNIRAYALSDGRPRWSAPMPEVPTETTMSYLDGRVIVSMEDTDSAAGHTVADEHTVALDARTGARLWASELGFAVIAEGGVLVESAPRPPGFNFVGTVATASFQLLDPDTGHPKWTIRIPDNCVTAPAGGSGGPVTALLELCANSSELTEVDLADGHTTATRRVDLGDPGVNFVLPRADQMNEPQLTIVGDTVLVAHANAPTPTLDAYAIGDLRQRWTGLPVVSGQDITACGAAMCVFDGASSGSVVDLSTGRRIGLVPPRAATAPDDGAFVLLPAGGSAAVTPPSIATGVSVRLPDASVPEVAASGVPASIGSVPPGSVPPGSVSPGSVSAGSTSTSGVTWLARWRSPGSARSGAPDGPRIGNAALVGMLPGVRTPSCVLIAGYLVCQTPPDHLSLWRL